MKFRVQGCLIIFQFLMSGCAAITVGIPSMRMDSPETTGMRATRGVRVATAVEGSSNIAIVDDYQAAPPKMNQPSSRKDPLLNANRPLTLDHIKPSADVSLLDNLDFSIRLHWNHPWMFGVKFQLLGEPETQAKKDDFSLALSSSTGIAFDNYEKQESTAASHSARADFYYLAFDSALIAGYRMSDRVLLYGGPFAELLNIRGHIRQPWNSLESWDEKGNAVNSGVNLGVQFSFPQKLLILFYKLEGSYTSITYKTESLKPIYFGAQIGVTL